MGSGQWDELVDHLVRTTLLPAAAARRVVDEVLSYFDEPVDAFIRRRHRELQVAGMANAAIFGCIAAELNRRPVAAPQLSERQVRRVIYG